MTQHTATTASPTRKPSIWDWIVYYYNLTLHTGWPFFFWIRPHWFPSQLGDRRGQVVFVTGGNSGTGYETALQYYSHGATVYIGCRSEARAQAAIASIKEGGTRDMYGDMHYTELNQAKVGTIEYVNLDLSDLDSVERCAQELQTKLPKLDLFYANAGIMATDPGQVTKQGYPLQFGTNTLGHQRLIALLLPLMQQTSKVTPDTPARLIVLSSVGHMFAPTGGVDYAALDKRVDLNKWAAYGESKWSDIALAKYVHAHYGPGSRNGAANGEVVAVSLHPGIIATNLSTHLAGVKAAYSLKWLTPMYQQQPATGALNQIWVGGVDTQMARTLSGKFVACFQEAIPARPDLEDPALVDRVWEWCESQTRKNE